MERYNVSTNWRNIAEHLTAGMMMNFDVLPKEESSNREGENDMRIIEVKATRFKFTPAQIRVKKWEKVALRINDVDANHGAQFGEMDVYYQENGNILLDTSTPWTYEYRCATMCGSWHQEMKWTVIVE